MSFKEEMLTLYLLIQKLPPSSVSENYLRPFYA